jgi:cysteinyl-tRNA synthetase
LNFTFDGLKAAATSIERLRNYQLRLKTGKFAKGLNPAIVDRTNLAMNTFDEALDDDLNTAEALAAAFEFVRDTNTAMDNDEFLADNVEGALAFLKRFDSVFDVLERSVRPANVAYGSTDHAEFNIRVLPSDAEINALVEERTAAKKARDFALADKLRQDLAAQGVIIEDTKEGVRWKRQ